MMEASEKVERMSPRSDWREQLTEAFIKTKPVEARIGNDKFELGVSGQEYYLTKNSKMMYSSSSSGSAYVLARFFVLVKESMIGFLGETGRRVIDRCVLEGLLRDAVETNLVAGKDAEKLKDVISSVFWSDEGEPENHSKPAEGSD